MNNIQNIKVTNTILQLKYNNKKALETSFKADTPQTRAQIIEIVKRAQQTAIKNKKDVEFSVGLKYDAGWRNDKFFNLTDEPILFDPENFYAGDVSTKVNRQGKYYHIKQQKTFKEFYILVVAKTPANGGYDIYNDCLYNTIVKGLGTADNMDIQWNTAIKFKNRLDLERADNVPLSLFSKIEDALKINLNCFGEHEYITTKNYNRTINIKLVNNHYSLDTDNEHSNKKYTLSTNRKPIAFYEILNDEYHIITDDKEWNEKLQIDKYYLSNKYKKYFFINQTKNIKTGINKNGKISKTKKVSLRQLFDEFSEAKDILLIESKGKIDLLKTPYPSQAVQRLFHNMSTAFKEPEEMNQHEAEWHDKCFRGGLINAEAGEYNDVICYDQNSQYSYYISHQNFLLPIKSGEFKIVDDTYIEKYAPYGIYRCKITSTDIQKNKLFRFNTFNYYTHSDISNAKRLKFNIELIQDGKVNCLFYETSKRVLGSKLYGEIVKYLFELKKKCSYTKKLISSLWGFHMERNYKKEVLTNSKEIVIADNYKIIGVERYDDHYKFKTTPYNKLFKTNYARIGCFLTSFVRCKMSEIIQDNFKLENVIRVHTDGIIVKNETIKDKYLGSELGNFKIEKQGKVNIVSSVDITWN